MDDGGETGLGEHNVGGATGSVGGTLDGDTDVGTGERGGVVGTVTWRRNQSSYILGNERGTHQS
jgi:hypothetical protein